MYTFEIKIGLFKIVSTICNNLNVFITKKSCDFIDIEGSTSCSVTFNHMIAG